ncbi:unnamed protein product [Gordionus sp. m RMFG-2023]
MYIIKNLIIFLSLGLFTYHSSNALSISCNNLVSYRKICLTVACYKRLGQNADLCAPKRRQTVLDQSWLSEFLKHFTQSEKWVKIEECVNGKTKLEKQCFLNNIKVTCKEQGVKYEECKKCQVINLAWSACKPDCGLGIKERTNFCLKLADCQCPSESTEKSICFNNECTTKVVTMKTDINGLDILKAFALINSQNMITNPGISALFPTSANSIVPSWGQWSPWEACSSTNNICQENRIRCCTIDGVNCIDTNPNFSNAYKCPETLTKEIRSCQNAMSKFTYYIRKCP